MYETVVHQKLCQPQGLCDAPDYHDKGRVQHVDPGGGHAEIPAGFFRNAKQDTIQEEHDRDQRNVHTVMPLQFKMPQQKRLSGHEHKGEGKEGTGE